MEYMKNFDEAEKLDKLKSKILKYILYKKRTEVEIRKKFIDEDENLLEDAIEYMKEQNYINDFDYIDRSINEFLNLKNMSIKEISYKLVQKGIGKNEIEQYIEKNYDILQNYELKSAQNIVRKKSQQKEFDEIINYLYQKGYTTETIEKLKYNLGEK